MAISRSRTRSLKGQSWFRGNPKSALQIKPALNEVTAAACRGCAVSVLPDLQVLVKSRRSR